MNKNRVKVITDGAIIIAIYLVVLIFSRFFGGILEEFIYLKNYFEFDYNYKNIIDNSNGYNIF